MNIKTARRIKKETEQTRLTELATALGVDLNRPLEERTALAVRLHRQSVSTPYLPRKQS